MFEYIIENFRNNSQFINDFDGLEAYLNASDISLESKNKLLKDVFEYNSKIYSIICEDNKRLEKIISARQVVKNNKKIPDMKQREISLANKKITPLQLDVSFYLQEIRSCSKLQDIETILPSKNKDNYSSIMYMVLVKMYEEAIDIKRMLFQENDFSDKDTINFFKNALEQIMFKIVFIKQLMKQEVTIVEPEKTINELVFLKTNYGNVCALSDLKDIPSCYYEDFYELLESICTGTFTNFKKFINNDYLKGLSEVRGEGTRIIFDRVGNNIYLIIYMFVKKTDRNASYQASLQNRNELYKSNEEEIKNLVNTNEEYLEENRILKEKIYRTLTKNVKVKKKGDING